MRLLRISAVLAALVLFAALVLRTDAQEAARAWVEPLPDPVWEAMQGASWHPGRNCPSRDDLALVTVPYLDFDGAPQSGRLVVAKGVAGNVADAFQAIFDSGEFRIQRMDLVDAFGGDDDASMAANNTSGFNCRNVPGTNRPSAHSLGLAVDINPVQNPYVTRRGTFPPAGAAYDQPGERTAGVTGIILHGDVVTRAFARIGWAWGGAWKNSKDYQHFSATGR